MQVEDSAGFDTTSSFKTPSNSYDEIFPALPDSVNPSAASSNLGQWNNKMRVESSSIQQIVKIKAEERKDQTNDTFGEKESFRICGNIAKDTSASIEIMVSKDQSMTFIVTGKPNNVVEARRKIMSHFQTQAHQVIAIPKEHHKLILGKSGQRLKDLERETETKISVPAMNDNSETITVTGAKDGIERAIHEIRTISTEQSKKAFERIIVPKIYQPFVCGPQNSVLNVIMADTGTKIMIPPPVVEKEEVTIAGDKEGVAEAKNKILAIVKEMEKKCTTVSVEVLKTQHKYVIGPKGSNISEILEKTGVSVEMPASDSDASNTIILRGPQEKLGNALSMVYEKANSVVTQEIDAPNWIHRYIIGSKGENIRKLKESFPKAHVEFVDKKDKIKIEGPPEDVKVLKEKILAKVKELTDQMTFVTLIVDPKYYKHIIGKNGANVNRLKEETDAVITISTTDTPTIRIEGIKDGVKKAKRELENMIYKLENEVEEEISIEHRYHSSIIGQKGDKIKEISNTFKEVQITFPNANEKKSVVKMRGPKLDVDQCRKYLENLVKELAENRYEMKVPVYKPFHKLVIGKGGANIRKIKDETHTKIDLPAEGDDSDVITITGKKENVEDAREKILRIQNEQANIVNEEITISMSTFPEKLANRLFRSISDECGGITIRPADSHHKKIALRGPNEDVDRAKQMLQDLSLVFRNYQRSNSAEVKASAQHHRFLKRNSRAKKIREATGCHIVFPSEQDNDQNVITIIGKADGVKQAKEELESIIREIDNIVEDFVDVDPKYHKQFMLRRSGQTPLQKITEDCGGISVSFPKQGDNRSQVVLKGSSECIKAAKAKILEFVDDLENQVTIECVIPSQHHKTLAGPKHVKAQELCTTYNVQIKFPDRVVHDEYSQQSEYDPDSNHQGPDGEPIMNGDSSNLTPRPSDIILITGKPEKCEAAKKALLDSVPVTETMDVPYDYHRAIIGHKGQTIRDLSSRFDVHINVPQSQDHQDWIQVTGSPNNVKLAKEAILDKMTEIDAENEDRKKRSHEVKLRVSAEYFPKIIGKRGAVINKIRDDHGVQINLPPRGSEDENQITIVGYQDKAEAARDDIMKIVNELDSLFKDEVEIDQRIYSRLIGARGRSIKKVMDQFKVEIRFAKPNDPNPDVVFISGKEEDVAEAKEHLLELQEQYLEDLEDSQIGYRPNQQQDEEPNLFAPNNSNGSSGGSHNQSSGFIVKNAPWEQKAPDTASTEEFPTFSGGGFQAPTPSSWGPRRQMNCVGPPLGSRNDKKEAV